MSDLYHETTEVSTAEPDTEAGIAGQDELPTPQESRAATWNDSPEYYDEIDLADEYDGDLDAFIAEQDELPTPQESRAATWSDSPEYYDEIDLADEYDGDLSALTTDDYDPYDTQQAVTDHGDHSPGDQHAWTSPGPGNDLQHTDPLEAPEADHAMRQDADPDTVTVADENLKTGTDHAEIESEPEPSLGQYERSGDARAPGPVVGESDETAPGTQPEVPSDARSPVGPPTHETGDSGTSTTDLTTPAQNDTPQHVSPDRDAHENDSPVSAAEEASAESAQDLGGPEIQPEKITFDGKDVEVTHDAADGIWVEGLPGESPTRIGDILSSPEEGERSRIENFRKELDKDAEDIIDMGSKWTDLLRDAFGNSPPTHSMTQNRSPEMTASQTDHGINVGHSVEAALTLTIVGAAAVHKLRERWQGARERKRGETGHAGD